MQMLAFTQHPYMLLSSKALPLWIALLSPRDSASKQEAHPPNPAHSLLPLECVSALLDLAGTLFALQSVYHQIQPSQCVMHGTFRVAHSTCLLEQI